MSGFHLLPGLSGVHIVKVVASAVACHYVAVSSDGVAYVWGRNENGQLGTGNINNVYLPSAVSAVTGVIDAAVGKGHTLLLTRSGSLWAAGSTNKGQCGVGKITDVPVLAWTPCRISGIVKVAAGNEFSVCCDKDGRLYSCGSKENGQTGLGKTGERIETAGKVTFDFVHTFVMHQTGEIFGQKVIDVACGAVHGACLTDVGTVYTWGCGGFGRLGHKNVEEQLLPTKVAFFGDRIDRKCRLVSCGASCTYFTCGQKEMVRLPPPPALASASHVSLATDRCIHVRHPCKDRRSQHVPQAHPGAEWLECPQRVCRPSVHYRRRRRCTRVLGQLPHGWRARVR